MNGKQTAASKSSGPLQFTWTQKELENNWAELPGPDQQQSSGSTTSMWVFFFILLILCRYACSNVKPFFKMAGFANSRFQSTRLMLRR